MAGVTSKGFTNKTYQEIIQEIITEVNSPSNLDGNFDAAPDSVFGVLTGVIAGGIKDTWDGLQAAVSQLDPEESEEQWLDSVGRKAGISRNAPTASTGKIVVESDEGLFVKANESLTTFSGNTVLTTENVTASLVASYGAKFQVVGGGDTFTGGTTVSITIEGTTYTDTPASNTAADTVFQAIANDINTDSIGVTATAENDMLILLSTNIENTFSVTGAVGTELATNGLSTIILATTAETGDFFLSSNDVDSFVESSLSGYTVSNPFGFDRGTAIEDDESYRQRILQGDSSSLYGTSEGIKQSLLENVSGVYQVKVINNRTLLDDPTTNTPAKSVHVFVAGGDQTAVAEGILEAVGGGIGMAGTITETVNDSNGDPQEVSFSRFQEVTGWVRINYEVVDEFSAPVDPLVTIQDVIVNNYQTAVVNERFAPSRLYPVLYANISGLYISSVEVAIEDDPSDIPVYSDQPITLGGADAFLIDASTVVATEV